MSWHIWFKPEIQRVPSYLRYYVPCSFDKGSDHSQSFRLLWLMTTTPQMDLHTCITSCNKCIVLDTAKRPPRIRRWNRQVPQDDFPGAICWSRPCKAMIQQPAGSNKIVQRFGVEIPSNKHANASLPVCPTVSFLQGNRFHLRGQFSKNGLQPGCSWPAQSSKFMDLFQPLAT